MVEGTQQRNPLVGWEIDMECPSCGIQLNEDGTVDVLPGEPDQHYLDCTATSRVDRHTE